MRKVILFFAITLLAVACGKENKTEEKIAEVPVNEVHIKRFDRVFFKSGPNEIPALKKDYPYLFPENTPDEVWAERMNDPFLKKLYDEVQKKYPDLKWLTDDLESLFKHIKYYYPDIQQPEVVTLVSDDLEVKSIYADNLVLIPLSLYLGKDNYLYEGLEKYRVKEFEPAQIVPDIVTSFSQGKIAIPNDKTLLSFMVYFGKELYIKDMLIPDATDAGKIGYTQEHIDWAKINESEIWRYFVDEKILYDTDAKLMARFINPAPFSKFYREIDNDSPGRIGRWLGWQIVRSYMKNNKKVTLQELLAKDAKEIFENSKYKPKNND